MTNLIGIILLIVIFLIIYLPFNDKFFNAYNLRKYNKYYSLVDNSDLDSLINDFNSGLITYEDFKTELIKLYPNIVFSKLDEIYLNNNYFEINDVLLNAKT
jgi:hypothetical protein